MDLNELLIELREKMEHDCCYGIRLNRNNEVLVFYHPWGCESEWKCKPEELESLLKRISEWVGRHS